MDRTGSHRHSLAPVRQPGRHCCAHPREGVGERNKESTNARDVAGRECGVRLIWATHSPGYAARLLPPPISFFFIQPPVIPNVKRERENEGNERGEKKGYITKTKKKKLLRPVSSSSSLHAALAVPGKYIPAARIFFFSFFFHPKPTNNQTGILLLLSNRSDTILPYITINIITAVGGDLFSFFSSSSSFFTRATYQTCIAMCF